MATPLQIARQRKIIYFGAIVVLFTASLVHREWIVKPQAFELQLREVSRGEVELTSSTVRLMLTGSRGLATTLLWYQAMDKQKRHEWHEFELLAHSITKLQPYFITPWLYQSWNISFNVAVECDRPRDKYYYISRGLELLSEGERRNRGVGDEGAVHDGKTIVFPGHPELRHYMGFTYQLKIGNSDERLTMRSLLELSCIDPIERDPSRFLGVDKRGKEIVKLDEFLRFCHNYPRLVRRLREQLSYAEPIDIVRFLKEHEKIPNRFKPITSSTIKESELKEPKDQFPILPPHEGDWPKPTEKILTNESLDVFVVCRAWYEFAQKPLPPPDTKLNEETPDYDKLRYRVPRMMVTQLFRQYPARARVFSAETLSEEGYFDSEGWDIPDWFDEMPNRQEGDESVVGRDSKYHSRLAWQRGHEAYRDYGIKNAIYLTPQQLKELNDKAELFRQKSKSAPGAVAAIRPEWRAGEIGESYDAHMKLYRSDYYRTLSNFNSFFYQTDAERDPITVSARKLLFYAERMRKRGAATELMLREYDNAWPMFMLACLKYPKFAQVSSMQEEFYEVYQHYLGQTQRIHRDTFKAKALQNAKLPFGPIPTEVVDLSNEQIETLAAQLANFPLASWRETIARIGAITEKEKDQQVMNTVAKMRKRTGALDQVQYYDGVNANDLRDFLFQWTQGAALATNESVASAISMPGQHYFLLTRRVNNIDADPPEPWRPLITPETRRITATRLGLDR